MTFLAARSLPALDPGSLAAASRRPYDAVTSQVRLFGRPQSPLTDKRHQTGKPRWTVLAKLLRLSDTPRSDALILGQTGGVLALWVAGSTLSLVTRVVLTRSLGAVDYGHYSLATAWAAWAATVADLGLPTLLVRALPRYRSEAQWGLIRGLLRRTNQCILLVSAIGVLVVGFVGLRLSPSPETQVHTFWVAALLVPLHALIMARSGALRGLRRVVTGELRHLILRAVLLALLACCLVAAIPLSPLIAVSITWLTMGITLVALSWLFRAAMPPQATHHAPLMDTGAWLKASLPMLALGSLFVLNRRVDMVMLGALHSARAAGIYSIASDWAGIVTYPFLALGVALSPIISQFYSLSRMGDLQRATTTGLRVAAPLAAAIVFAIVVAGRSILAIHGPNFAEGYVALVVLSGGQLVLTFAGPIGPLLVMTRHEVTLLALSLATAVLNLSLNAILIPRWGICGSAVATTTSTVAMALTGVWLVRHYLGINSTIFARTRLPQDTSADTTHPPDP